MKNLGIRSKAYLTQVVSEPDHPFPYPAFTRKELETFERFFRFVWKATPSFFPLHGVTFGTDDEEDISFAVATVIDQLTSKRSEDFAWFLDIFQYEGLAAMRPNFSRTSIRKQCDFAFRRVAVVSTRLRSLDCLFAEAKIVSPSHTMGYYARSGIKRFLEGSYAYAMPQAVLIGYVRETDQTLPKALLDHFNRKDKKDQLEILQWPTPFVPSRAGAIRMYVTQHERRVPNEEGEKKPGPITLFHLWLHVNSDR